eukprot:3977739-Pleurochrysis_carterae.AAC.1
MPLRGDGGRVELLARSLARHRRHRAIVCACARSARQRDLATFPYVAPSSEGSELTHSCSVVGGPRRDISPPGCCAPATFVRGTDHLREQARYPPQCWDQRCVPPPDQKIWRLHAL